MLQLRPIQHYRAQEDTTDVQHPVMQKGDEQCSGSLVPRPMEAGHQDLGIAIEGCDIRLSRNFS